MKHHFEIKDKKQIAICSICTVLLAVMAIFCFINRDLLRYWVSNGTGIIAGQQYTFTPRMENEEDIIKQVICPVRNGLSSIEIRLANEHPEAVDCTLLFSLYNEDETELILQESVSSDEIINWRYYTLALPTYLQTGHEYILTVQCPDNRGGIPFKVFICNVDLEENRDLTFNDEAVEGGLDLIYNYYTFPTGYFTFLIILYLTGIMIVWIKKDYFKNKIFCYIVLIFTAVMYSGMIEYLSGNSFLENMSATAIAINLLIMFCLFTLVLAICNRSLWTGVIIGAFAIVLAIVNHFTLQFRGTVILPSDIYSVSTAYNVVDNYSLALDKEIFHVISILPLMLLLLYKTNFKQTKKPRIITGILSAAMFFAVLWISFNEGAQVKLDIKIRQDAQTARSQEIGFLLNLCENVRYFYLQKPKGYSDSAVEDIYAKYSIADEKTDNTAGELPNIIVIMNESFADLRYLGELDTNVEYMPNLYRIAEGENSKIGKCVVSVFGGGTSCSEFEFLTGCTMMFLPAGNAPYQQFIHSQTQAIASYLKQESYDTYALHPANPLSWSRNVAYPLLGFNRFISIADEEFDDAVYCRYWIDDQSLINEVKTLHEETKDKLFAFALTIQCHGGYEYENYVSTVSVQNMSADYPDVGQYLSLVKESDQAFGDLVDTLKDSDEPTIVLMYGDHLPQFNSAFYEEMSEQSGEDVWSSLKMYETPYILWANYDVDFSEVPDTVSANFLSPYVLKAAGIELDPYYQYLYALSQKYPVISRAGIQNSEGELCEYVEGDVCYEDIHEYEIIQYNRLTN